MSGLAVDQFVPTLMPRDAVGNHTLQLQAALREEGVGGGIWGLTIDGECRDRALPYGSWSRPRSGPPPVLLYQAASVSGGIVDFLLRRREPVSVNYHNLTPPAFYERWDERVAALLGEAVAELERLAPRVRVAVADSHYNARDLVALGVPDVTVCPPFLGSSLDAAPAPQLLAALRSQPGLKLVFVSRLAPSKGHRQLVRALAAVRAGVDPAARLFLVGAPGPAAYVGAIVDLADRLCPGGLELTGPVTDSELAAYYAAADIYLCMSEHEGFGIPLVEAMRMRVPIVALDTSAVAETLGGSGVLLSSPDPLVAAEAVARVVADAGLREALLRRQSERARELETFPRGRVVKEAMARAAGC